MIASNAAPMASFPLLDGPLDGAAVSKVGAIPRHITVALAHVPDRTMQALLDDDDSDPDAWVFGSTACNCGAALYQFDRNSLAYRHVKTRLMPGAPWFIA